MANKFLLFVLLLTFSISASGQTFLVLEKMGTKKRYEFHRGEQIEVKLNQDNYFTRINIVGLSDSLIYAGTKRIKLSNIKTIRLSKNSTLNAWGSVIVNAGVLLVLADLFNQTVVQGGSFNISSGVSIASASLVSFGAILKLAGRNKVKVKKWWRLRVVQL